MKNKKKIKKRIFIIISIMLILSFSAVIIASVTERINWSDIDTMGDLETTIAGGGTWTSADLSTLPGFGWQFTGVQLSLTGTTTTLNGAGNLEVADPIGGGASSLVIGITTPTWTNNDLADVSARAGTNPLAAGEAITFSDGTINNAADLDALANVTANATSATNTGTTAPADNASHPPGAQWSLDDTNGFTFTQENTVTNGSTILFRLDLTVAPEPTTSCFLTSLLILFIFRRKRK